MKRRRTGLTIVEILVVVGIINLASSPDLIYVRPDWWWCFPIVLFTLVIFCYAFFRRQAWYGEVLVVSAYRVLPKRTPSASGPDEEPVVECRC